MQLALAILMAVSTLNTDVLTASLGRSVALAYGRHIVGGNVILKDESETDITVMFVALGEGIWDALEWLNINAQDVDLEAADIFHLHKGLPGQLSSGSDLTPEGVGSLYPFDTDGDQKVDAFTPPVLQGVTFSNSAYLAMRIPFDQFAPSADITVLGRYRCRKVRMFDAGGVQTDFAWSENPWWQIADLLTTVRGLSDGRINWASFVAAANYCDALITPHAEVGEVKRFISNVAFTEEVDFDQALDALLVTCRGFLFDDGSQIYARVDQTRAPVFDFNMDNIIDGSFSSSYKDTREVANRLELMFRDTDNDFAIMQKNWNHEPQQARTGRVIPARLHLGNMPQHQAERIGNYLLTRAIDNNQNCRFRGTPETLKVMPGDVVRILHDTAPWSQGADGDARYQSFEVLEASDNPDETRDFLCRVYNAATYPDTSGPTQNLVGGDLGRSQPVPPPQPTNAGLTANLSGDLRLKFAIPTNADYAMGDLTMLVDEDIDRSVDIGDPLNTAAGFSFLDGAIADDAVQLTVFDKSSFRVGHYATVGRENLKISGPGTTGQEPSALTFDVIRAQLGTLATAQDNQSTIRPLTARVEHWAIPVGYTLTHPTDLNDNDTYFVKRFRPGRVTLLHARLIMTSSKGLQSEPIEMNFAEFPITPIAGMLPGLRVASGKPKQTLQIPGPIRVGEDLALPFIFGSGDALGPVYITLDVAPTGQSMKGRLRLDGDIIQDSLFGPTVDVEWEIAIDGFGTGTFYFGDFLGNLFDKRLLLVIDQVGSDEPGEGLVLHVNI